MNDALMRLLAFDRLVELIGEGRLQEIVARRLPELQLLAALDANGLDPDRLAALLAKPPVQPPVEPPVEVEDYYSALLGLLSYNKEQQPRLVPLNQTWIGRHHMTRPATPQQVMGVCYTACMSQVENEEPIGLVSVREQFVLSDRDAWLNGDPIQITHQGGTISLKDSPIRCQAAFEEYCKEQRDTGTAGWSFVITFKYASIEARDAIEDAKGLKRPKPSKSMLFEVGREGSTAGYLLREVFDQDRILDHWYLLDGYLPPAGTQSLTLTLADTATPHTWQGFTEITKEGRNSTDTGKGWYVPTIYTLKDLSAT